MSVTAHEEENALGYLCINIKYRWVYHIVVYLPSGGVSYSGVSCSSENERLEYVGYANNIEYEIKSCHKYLTIPG